MRDIGKNIKKIRSAKGMSQEELDLPEAVIFWDDFAHFSPPYASYGIEACYLSYKGQKATGSLFLSVTFHLSGLSK